MPQFAGGFGHHGQTGGRGCRVCGTPLPPPKLGESRAYCSTACRREVEFAVRRADRVATRMDRLLLELAELRYGLGGHLTEKARAARIKGGRAEGPAGAGPHRGDQVPRSAWR